LAVPEVLADLFDLSHAELTLQEYHDTLISIISQIPEDIRRILGDNPIDIASLLGIDIDVNATRTALTNALMQATDVSGSFDMVFANVQRLADELVNYLERADIDFVSRMDYEDLRNFNATSAPEFVNWLNQFRQAQQELAAENDILLICNNK